MTAHSHHTPRKPTTGTNPRASWALANALRFLGQVLRGLVAVVVLLALVAGLPWGLAHFVGWPLPDHVPTWDEIEATLLHPMNPQLLLNTLAVLCWFVWFLFTIDVLRCTVDAARGITWPRVQRPGPLHGLAAALVGMIALTLLGSRTPYTVSTQAGTALMSDLTPVAAIAPLTPGSTAHAPIQQAALAAPHTTLMIDPAAPAPPGTVQVTEQVRLPQNGIYDSLWRVAERIYGPGGGSRWPELFQLNRGIEQPDGRTLTHPNLVRPGWKITAYIAIPPAEPPTYEQPPRAPSSHPVPPTDIAPTTPPTQPVPTTQSPAATDQADDRNTDQAQPGLDLATGVFISLGLASAITAAMVSARMWRRRRYRVGSGDRADLQRPIAPIVRALRATPDEHQHSHDVEFLDLTPAPTTYPRHRGRRARTRRHTGTRPDAGGRSRRQRIGTQPGEHPWARPGGTRRHGRYPRAPAASTHRTPARGQPPA
ncbi:LysM peptidoglycan-binding domain-containing protein [Kibdelosporangium aridum]|uniref:LysM peptidoglycan-binding domain-containing protein n=1 Tax=Kibdelosporangium aridum TaxID=2030 RepID=UPI0035E6C4F0